MIILTEDVLDETYDSFFIPKGSIASILSHEDGYWIAEYEGFCFRVFDNQFEFVED